MEEHISDSRKNFAYFQAVIIEKLLNLVINDSNEVPEEIEKMKSAANRICSNEDCKTIDEKVKYKCDNCNSKVIEYKPEITPRENSSRTDERYKLPLNMANNQNSPKISMAEPIFLNPNSYEVVYNRELWNTFYHQSHLSLKKHFTL